MNKNKLWEMVKIPMNLFFCMILRESVIYLRSTQDSNPICCKEDIMKEYEIVAKLYNACAGSSRPQTFFEEAELNDPADYVRQKHGRDFEKFRKEVLANGQIVFSYDNGSVTYRYEFAEL